MPEITLTLEEEDLQLITRIASRKAQTPEEWFENWIRGFCRGYGEGVMDAFLGLPPKEKGGGT